MHDSFEVVETTWFIWETVGLLHNSPGLDTLALASLLGNLRGAIGFNFAQTRGVLPKRGGILAQERRPLKLRCSLV